MKRILLGLLFLSGTVAAQENDKSIAILGGPSDLWTNNRLNGKDEFNGFSHLGLQYTKRKSASLDVVYTTLAGYKGELFSPSIWNNKFVSAGVNMRYFFSPRKKTSVINPFFQIGADAFARRDYGYLGNAYELSALGGLGIDIKLSRDFSFLAQTNLAIPMAQSTEAGVKIASVRGSNNSTSFGLVYHFGWKAAKKKMDEEAVKAREEAAIKAAAEAAEQDRLAKIAADKKAVADAKEKAEAMAKAEAEAKAKADAIAKADAEAKAAAQLKADQEAMAETTILYMNNKWELTAESTAKLTVVASALAARPDINVRIDGHSDAYGTSKNNIKASRFRAQGAANFLVKSGIAATRLQVNAYGEDKPAASNDTKAGMTLNRRIEIRIIK